MEQGAVLPLPSGMTNPPEFQVTSGGAIALQPVAVARKSPSRLFWDRLKQDKAALAGAVVIVLLILIAIFGGPIASNISGHPQNATYSNMTDEFGVPLGPNTRSGSAPTRPAAISSCGRCTARARRCSSASSLRASRC